VIASWADPVKRAARLQSCARSAQARDQASRKAPDFGANAPKRYQVEVIAAKRSVPRLSYDMDAVLARCAARDENDRWLWQRAKSRGYGVLAIRRDGRVYRSWLIATSTSR
jgi:hypothetical protein